MQAACLPRELEGGGLVVAGGIFPHSVVFLQEPVTAVLQGTAGAAQHRICIEHTVDSFAAHKMCCSIEVQAAIVP
jgi:hypothetical protein